MRLLTFLFIVCVLLACLEKAIAGPGTSSKRKRDESSDEWADWSLNLATKNQLPASLAKVNIEKANKSGAQGLKLPGKKGKTTNAARTMRRARKRTSKPNMWPSYYWAKIPMKDPKTNQKKTCGIAFCCHMSGLPVYGRTLGPNQLVCPDQEAN